MSQRGSLPPSEVDVDVPESEYSYRQTRRTTNVYDAVAGRVNRKGHHPAEPFASRYRDTASSGARSLRPEEVLYRTQNTVLDPVQEERYFAHENLPSTIALPNSDLLEAIHAYAADFYEFATVDHGIHDQHSMDETALIAMGILVEEMAKDALGQTGDLVLVEGEELDPALNDTGVGRDFTTHGSQSRERARRRKRSHTGATKLLDSQDNLRGVRPSSKRRRLKGGASSANTDTELDER